MVYMYHIFFIHSSLNGHLGFFHVLAVVNSAALNIGVHVSFWIIVLLRYMLPGLPWWFRWYTFQPSLVAQIVKNLPAMWETWVWSLGWEDPLKEGMATHSSILSWRIPRDRGAWQATVHRTVKGGHGWATKYSTTQHRQLKNFTGCQ